MKLGRFLGTNFRYSWPGKNFHFHKKACRVEISCSSEPGHLFAMFLLQKVRLPLKVPQYEEERQHEHTDRRRKAGQKRPTWRTIFCWKINVRLMIFLMQGIYGCQAWSSQTLSRKWSPRMTRKPLQWQGEQSSFDIFETIFSQNLCSEKENNLI